MPHLRLAGTAGAPTATLAGLLLGAALLSNAAFAAGNEAHGVWMRGDGNARVRIAPCGAALCATNLWVRDKSGGEAVGDRLVMTVEPRDAGTLEGKAFDPKRKLNYSIRIKISDAGLVTRGCIVGGLLCKDVRWTRGD